MASLPDRGDELLHTVRSKVNGVRARISTENRAMYDALVFLGTVLVAFGLGWRLDLWLENDAYMAPVFYTVILGIVFWKWVLEPYQ